MNIFRTGDPITLDTMGKIINKMTDIQLDHINYVELREAETIKNLYVLYVGLVERDGTIKTMGFYVYADRKYFEDILEGLDKSAFVGFLVDVDELKGHFILVLPSQGEVHLVGFSDIYTTTREELNAFRNKVSRKWVDSNGKVMRSKILVRDREVIINVDGTNLIYRK